MQVNWVDGNDQHWCIHSHSLTIIRYWETPVIFGYGQQKNWSAWKWSHRLSFRHDLQNSSATWTGKGEGFHDKWRPQYEQRGTTICEPAICPNLSSCLRRRSIFRPHSCRHERCLHRESALYLFNTDCSNKICTGIKSELFACKTGREWHMGNVLWRSKLLLWIA